MAVSLDLCDERTSWLEDVIADRSISRKGCAVSKKADPGKVEA